MAADRSTIILCPDAFRANANKVLARIFGDAPTSQNLSVALSATGSAPATHWALHIWEDQTTAASLAALPTLGGTLPTFTDGLAWSDFGITQLQAIAASAALTSHVATGAVPTDHLAGILSGHGLKTVVPDL